MAQRREFIAVFFEGDLTLENQVKDHIREMLNVLTRNFFLQVYNEAEQEYLNKQAVKDHLTLGVSFWMRVYKSNVRFPNDISDENVQEKLKNFLLGPGNKDLKSLKYKFLQQLLFCYQRETWEFDAENITVMKYDYLANTDRQAENLIDMTLEVLGHKPALTLIEEAFKP